MGMNFVWATFMKLSTVLTTIVEKRIFLIRGERVMLSSDLARLYQVGPGVLLQAIKRNISRFPGDFMFQLNQEEWGNLKSQNVISSSKWGGSRHPPYALTEQGIAMLSSVLKSETAIQVNVEIIRAFVRLRGLIMANQDLAKRLDALEKRYDGQFKAVFEAIRQVMEPVVPAKKRIGIKNN